MQPQISFVPVSGRKESFVWAIDDIIEIKKVESRKKWSVLTLLQSHVSMTRLALGWASGADIEGLGLEIRFKSAQQQIIEAQGGVPTEGETLKFASVGRREQLFVRLVSMGRQRWEVL